MRHIIVVLVAMLVLSAFMPATWAQPKNPVLRDNYSALGEPAQTELLTTPTMAAFINNSWMPSSFVPPIYYADTTNKKGYVPNSTNAIYDFLNSSWVPPSAKSPIYSANAPDKSGTIAWTGESIYQFLDNNWTPSTPVVPYTIGTGYKLHEMS